MLDPPILTFTGICFIFILALLTYYYVSNGRIHIHIIEIFFVSSSFNLFLKLNINKCCKRKKKILAFKNTDMEQA